MKRWGGLVAAPVFLGGCIYLLFRPAGLVMFDWARALGTWDVLAHLRQQTLPVGAALPDPLVYALPQALWCFGLVNFIGLTWRDAAPRGALKPVMAMAVLLSVAGELGQYMALLPGTYDTWDLLLASLLAFCAAMLHVSPKARFDHAQAPTACGTHTPGSDALRPARSRQ